MRHVSNQSNFKFSPLCVMIRKLIFLSKQKMEALQVMQISFSLNGD